LSRALGLVVGVGRREGGGSGWFGGMVLMGVGRREGGEWMVWVDGFDGG